MYVICSIASDGKILNLLMEHVCVSFTILFLRRHVSWCVDNFMHRGKDLSVNI